MSSFKPMVKMYTDEPSAILKLKKGGKVKSKESKKEKSFEGHKPMHVEAFESESGSSPKKPSMAERLKAMKPKKGKMEKMPGKAINQPSPLNQQRIAKPAVSCKADGGSVDALGKDMTKTTVKGNTKAFEKTLMLTGEKLGKTKGKTGGVKEANAGNFAKGSKVGRAETVRTGEDGDKIPNLKVDKNYSKGGKFRKGGTVGERVPSDTHEFKDSGKKIFGETIGDNEGDFVETQMHSQKPDKVGRKTGGVDMANAGGFKRGGKIKKAEGGRARLSEAGNVEKIDRKFTKNTVEGGDWENIPADTTPKGKTNTSTGEVKEANAGGFKHGGHAKKKVYASGGNVVDDGRPEKMKTHFISAPVANSLQSGTFAKGGKVEKEEKPNLRLMKTYTGPNGHVAKVYKDKDWDEYRTKFYTPEGKHLVNSDSHTSDKSDAHDTAQIQVNKGYSKGGKAK